MAKIVLQSNASGNGTLTITAPSTNTDFTLNIPAESGSLLTSTNLSEINVASNILVANSTAVVVNEDGNDVDFRVEGDTNANLLFVDASADAVGVGTGSPSVGGAYSAGLAVTVFGGTNSGLEDTAYLEIGSSTNTNDYQTGAIAFYNNDNSGAGPTTRKQTAIIRTLCATSDSNADDDSGGNLTFITKTEAGTLAERMRITADATPYLRLASGTGGIQFGGDTAAANALDDYEEGTWTPVITTYTGTVTYGSSRFGEYRKIGSAVFVEVNVTFTCSTGGAYILTCSLPFTASYATASVYPAMAVAGFYNIDLSAGGTAAEAYTTNGSATCNFHASGDSVTQGSLLTNSNTALTMEIRFSGVFFAS